MDIVVINLGDIWVTDNYEREAAEGNNSFSKVDWEDRAGVPSRGEEILWGKWRPTVANNGVSIRNEVT